MTDVSPGVRSPRWAILIGTLLSRARVFVARVKVYFQLAPVLTTGVIGLVVGLSIAQWSQKQIESTSPMVELAPERMKAGTIGRIWWRADDSAAISFDGTSRFISLGPDGEIDATPIKFLAYPDVIAMNGLVGLPAEDGVLLARTDTFEVVTPGGLAAIDGKGSLFVTGAARIRNVNGSSERGIQAVAPNGRTVWRTELFPASSGQPRFVSAFSWDTTVTAMTALPGSGGIAVGGADGRIAFIQSDGTSTTSTDQAASEKGPKSHGLPIVALATSGSFETALGKTVLASAASDGSIKIWYLQNLALTSRDVLFPADTSPPPLASDSLELSDDGQTLAVRTTGGAMFIASLRGENATLADFRVNGGARFRSSPVTMTNLRLGFATAASALSRGFPLSIYVGTPDCSIQELDLSNSAESPAGDGSTAITPMIRKLTLRGHGGPITRLAMSHNGQYLAAASLDGRARIHHLSSLKTLSAFPLANLPTGSGCAISATLELIPQREITRPVAQKDSAPQVQSQTRSDDVDDSDCPGLTGAALIQCKRVNTPCYAMRGAAADDCLRNGK